MYKTTFQRIKPTLAAVIVGYKLISANNTAYADSGSAEVNVSVTVVEPVEREIKKISPYSSVPSQWKKAPGSNYIINHLGPDTATYDFEHDDFAWLDYVPPTKPEVEAKRLEAGAFYESLNNYQPVTEGSSLFESWKTIVKGLSPSAILTTFWWLK